MARLGEMLIKEQLITDKQLQDALVAQKKGNKFLGEVLVDMRAVTERQLVDVLVRQTNASILDLSTTEVDKSLTKIFPYVLARKTASVAVKLTGNLLTIAMTDPSDTRAVDTIASTTGKTVKAFLTGFKSLYATWDTLYGKNRDDDLLAKSLDNVKRKLDSKVEDAKQRMLVSKDYSADEEESDEDEAFQPEEIDIDQFDKIVSTAIDQVEIIKDKDEGKNIYGLTVEAEAAPIIKLVNGIFIKALEMDASDIHIEPFEKEYRVRFRVDGELHTVMKLPPHVRNAVTSRIKIMSELDISERRIPQDGRVKLKLGAHDSVDLRVSTLPSIFGEKICIRILGQSNLGRNIASLGMDKVSLNNFNITLSNPYGMILVTGPTGSGKSTTLYTAIGQINKPNVNIVTAEDPVEYNMHGITQVNVRPAIGYTFDMALRAFLRQDPDVILVGEMRDLETAGIAVKAALTGHLVLSTLHTNDTGATIARLVDMGIDPFMVSAAVKLIIAQRLVRKLCEDCKEPKDISEHHMALLQALEMPEDQVKELNSHVGVGCPKCNTIGYRGRMPVFEVMTINNREIKEAIIAGKTPLELNAIGKKNGMMTLGDSAFALVKNAMTSLSEAFKVTVVE